MAFSMMMVELPLPKLVTGGNTMAPKVGAVVRGTTFLPFLAHLSFHCSTPIRFRSTYSSLFCLGRLSFVYSHPGNKGILTFFLFGSPLPDSSVAPLNGLPHPASETH